MGQHKTKKYEIEWSIDEDGVVCLDELYVHHDHRNKGIGSKAMNWFLNKFSDRTIELVANPLDDNITVEALEKFYESFGFETVDYSGGMAFMRR